MATTETERGNRKTRIGTVVSAAMDKTVIVRVDRRAPHPVFKKIITRSKRYYAHDSENAYKVGDIVKIVETRPLSKTKRWRVTETVSLAAG
jgi:small subunit ribosomal protein S17